MREKQLQDELKTNEEAREWVRKELNKGIKIDDRRIKKVGKRCPASLTKPEVLANQ